jgi:hypothetical protein
VFSPFSNFGPGSLCGASPSQKVNDQNDKRNYQQQVNQAAGYMQAESQKPKNQNNYKDGPKHESSLLPYMRMRTELSHAHASIA